MLRRDDTALALGDRAAGLVYAASSSVVDTTVVAGRVLIEGGAIAGFDEILARTLERAQRLGVA